MPQVRMPGGAAAGLRAGQRGVSHALTEGRIPHFAPARASMAFGQEGRMTAHSWGAASGYDGNMPWAATDSPRLVKEPTARR